MALRAIFRYVFRTLSPKNLKTFNDFCKNDPSYMFERVVNTPII